VIENRIYEFTLEATSPVAVGSHNSEEILKDALGTPFIPGTSIVGALRDYLIRVGESEQTILQYLGGIPKKPTEDVGSDTQQQQKFIESRIYISDGAIVSQDGTGQIQVANKQGTAIEPKYRTAKNNHKYNFEYLKPGFLMTFRIESDIHREDDQSAKPDELERLIKVWAFGIQEGDIRLGGHKNNDFGRFLLKSVEIRKYEFTDAAAIDDFIFNRRSHASQTKSVRLEMDSSDIRKEQSTKISISMQGCFPYGVYQSFSDTETGERNHHVEVTGLLKNTVGSGWYIPSSSMKGLLQSECRSLLLRMLAGQNRGNHEAAADHLCGQLFGNAEQRGILIVADMKLDATSAKEVIVNRPDTKDRKSSTLPVYVKIDRLTGGVLGSALKHQNEIHGYAEWHLEFRVNDNVSETHPFIFPLVYILRRIGAGKVPIGGRSAIGLGQFQATRLEFAGSGWRNDNLQCEPLQQDNLEWLKRCYSALEQWINSQYEAFQGR